MLPIGKGEKLSLIFTHEDHEVCILAERKVGHKTLELAILRDGEFIINAETEFEDLTQELWDVILADQTGGTIPNLIVMNYKHGHFSAKRHPEDGWRFIQWKQIRFANFGEFSLANVREFAW